MQLKIEKIIFKNKPINFKPIPWPRSQDLKPLISLPFVINILRRNDLVKGFLRWQKTIFLHT